VLSVVHDDDGVRALLARDLHERFGEHYEIEVHASGDEALATARRHAKDGRPVAAVFAADRDPVRLLRTVLRRGPAARRAGKPHRLARGHARA
jgi:hypothetical protein